MKRLYKNTIDSLVISFLLFCFTLYYMKVFEGGVKTSMAVKEWGIFFLSAGVVVMMWRRKDIYKKRITAISLVTLLFLLGTNILLFDYLNIVVEYEDWLKRGLNLKN